MKKIRELTALLTASLMFCFSVGGLPRTISAEEDEWKSSDFVIENGVLYGFSPAGVTKLKDNPQVTLPSEDEQHQPVTKIASFAFTPNKSADIDNYMLRWKKSTDQGFGLDEYGVKIEKKGADFNASMLQGVKIPEGYTEVGQDAFRENSALTELKLPNSLQWIKIYAFGHTKLGNLTLGTGLTKIDDLAFFDAQVKGDLEFPAGFTSLGERAFKNNQLTNIVFKGNKLTEIKDCTFQDNSLTQLNFPTSIKKIAPDAFNGNIGVEEYGDKVVIRTTSPAQKISDGENFYCNPKDDKKIVLPELDVSKWVKGDFVIEHGVIKGFSKQGLRKIKRNKDVKLPDADASGAAVTEIADNAFRNIDMANESYRKFDIASVTLPKSLVRIGKYAFQCNNLTTIDFQDCEHLTEIDAGAFMDNQIADDFLSFPDSLKKIGAAAFHLNSIKGVILTLPNLQSIGTSAFRKNNISTLMFSADNLAEIGEMAFAENNLSDELDLSQLPALKKIGVQTFRNNKITSVQLPPNLEKIEAQAFYNNDIKQITLPDSVTSITFNAFSNDVAGKPKTVIIANNPKNIDKLPAGDGFVVNPDKKMDDIDKAAIKKALAAVKALPMDKLRSTTQKQFSDILNDGEKILKNSDLSKSEALKFVADTNFFLGRTSLDEAIAVGQAAEKNVVGADAIDLKNLHAKLEKAAETYNNAAVAPAKVDRLITELKNWTSLVKKEGPLAEAKMIQVYDKFSSPLDIPPYIIALQVYVDKSGKILFVSDQSYRVGEGQKNEFGAPIENVDEDNQGYHELALPTLAQYEGRNIDEIINGKFTDLVKGYGDAERYHVKGMFDLVVKACREAKAALAADQNHSGGSRYFSPVLPLLKGSYADGKAVGNWCSAVCVSRKAMSKDKLKDDVPATAAAVCN